MTVPDRRAEYGALPDGGSGGRPTRRLSDKLLSAFHQACDQMDLDVAEQILRILEGIVTRRPPPPDARRRRSVETLVAAHERLWLLRHPGEE